MFRNVRVHGSYEKVQIMSVPFLGTTRIIQSISSNNRSLSGELELGGEKFNVEVEVEVEGEEVWAVTRSHCWRLKVWNRLDDSSDLVAGMAKNDKRLAGGSEWSQ
jgi:hypothetical protein